MNREIKFRAFDDNSVTTSLINSNFGLSIFFQFLSEDAIVMQYTGLKDKNGVEIYEGDIVKFHYFYMSFGENMGALEAEHELTGIVEFGNFGWGLSAIEGEHWCGYTGYKNGEGSSNFLDLMAMNESEVHEESFEVIGHIYEEKI